MNRFKHLIKAAAAIALTYVLCASALLQPMAVYAATLQAQQPAAEVADASSAQDSSAGDVSDDTTDGVSKDADSADAVQDKATPADAADEDQTANEEDAVAPESLDAGDEQTADDTVIGDSEANSWRYQNGELRSDLRDDNATDLGVESRSMHEMPEGATLQGIDVSGYQKDIDWQKVKDAGIDFAILKIGNINAREPDGWYTDSYFQRNVTECERLGIPYGVYAYSYAKNADDAVKGANHIIALLEGHKPTLPVYLDLEDNSIKDTDHASIAKAFCNMISAAGYTPGIYASASWFKNILTDPCFTNSGWGIWTAQYWYGQRYDASLGLGPEYPAKFDCWQYSILSTVPGIDGYCDINYWYGNSIPETTDDPIESELVKVAQRYSVQLGAITGTVYKFEDDGWRLDCEHGSAVFSKKSGAYPVWGDIYTYWNSESNANSLGAPVGEPCEFSTSHGSGWSQDFEQGAIQWNGSDGYVSVRSGAIRTEYVRRGYQAGALGWPVAEAEELAGGGSRQRFQGGTIVTSEHGTFEMDGEMEDLWNKLGGVSGLGYPLTNAKRFNQNGGGYATDFERGSIHWTKSTRAVSVRSGAIRTEYVRRGYQAGALGWPVAEAEELAGGGSRQRFQGGVISVTSTGSVSVNTNYQGFQNPSSFYQVSNRSVSIPHQGQGIFGYRTPSRISLYATRNDCIEAAISRAYDYLGTPYRWDYSCAPGVGVDCAGLVMQSLYATGMNLGRYNPWDHYYTPGHDHYANDMWNDPRFKHLSFSQRRRGDLICYPGHIAIYLGNDTIIEAYPPRVRISSVYSSGNIRGVLRPFV